MNVVKAALSYFGIVFGVGFLLGTIRVLAISPRIGSRAAELAEMPLMVGASILAALWTCRRFREHRAGATIAIGLLALTLLVVAELAVGVVVRRQALGEILAGRDPVSAAAYRASLAVFGAAPWLVSRFAERAAGSRTREAR